MARWLRAGAYRLYWKALAIGLGYKCGEWIAWWLTV